MSIAELVNNQGVFVGLPAESYSFQVKNDTSTAYMFKKKNGDPMLTMDSSIEFVDISAHTYISKTGNSIQALSVAKDDGSKILSVNTITDTVHSTGINIKPIDNSDQTFTVAQNDDNIIFAIDRKSTRLNSSH